MWPRGREQTGEAGYLVCLFLQSSGVGSPGQALGIGLLGSLMDTLLPSCHYPLLGAGGEEDPPDLHKTNSQLGSGPAPKHPSSFLTGAEEMACPPGPPSTGGPQR